MSKDGKQWQLVAEGEFPNVINNRVEQQVRFPKQLARYVKLQAKGTAAEGQQATFAEFGVLTELVDR